MAAYCRVSTDSEEQLTSYQNQMRVYTEMIAANKEWEFAGLYADEGISGTRADKRPEFQRMIRDCQNGKIDYIITKSVSRFARNTVECLEYVRSLKAQGISVITHLILGLPSETHEQMLSSVKKISTLPLDGVKLQLLHVLENTDLADYYKKEGFSVLSQKEYVELIIDCLEYLPQNVVIHRLTGDGPRKLLLAPEWSIHKKQVLKQIQRRLKERDTYQGRLSEL